jgi:hypothetical protein
LTRARDVANVLSTATSLATDTETAAAISSHNTRANGHFARGTTANRPGSPAVGDLYYDTTLDGLIQYTANEGWKLIGSVGVLTPSMTGGILASDSTYYYRSFSSTGNLSVSNGPITADILVVAGGGAGGAAGGGGGAGGLLAFTSQSLSSQTYTVTVGAGGTGSNGAGGMPTNGSNSQFGSLTAAVGGGYAAGFNNSAYYTAAVGGSGGGGAYNPAGQFAAGTAGQGNSGNNGFQDIGGGAPRSGGGGGGAGGAATNGGVSNTGGNGGVGSSSYSTWGAATGYGQNISGTRWFAGGGGGQGGTVGGTGGSGGGGAGTTNFDLFSNNGSANTGGGGGGGQGNPVYAGSNGGSGIVIVRYTRSQVGG